MNYQMSNQSMQQKRGLLPLRPYNYSEYQILYNYFPIYSNKPSNGWVYDAWQESNIFHQNVNNYVVPQWAAPINYNLETELKNLKLYLKYVLKAKSDQEMHLYSVVQESQKLSEDNKKLQKENSVLQNTIKTAKDAYSEEIDKLKLNITMLEDKLKDCSSHVLALNQVNEMLIQSIEKRDKIIIEYKHNMQESLNSIPERISLTETLQSASGSSTPSIQFNALKERPISRKALHALTALGAENALGPWLCSLCSTDVIPLKISTYSEYRQHLINVHKKIIDPALCEHCGWRSSTDRELGLHVYKEHQIESLFYRCSKKALLKEREHE